MFGSCFFISGVKNYSCQKRNNENEWSAAVRKHFICLNVPVNVVKLQGKGDRCDFKVIKTLLLSLTTQFFCSPIVNV